jgi:CBS-domain-containing membrane protein
MQVKDIMTKDVIAVSLDTKVHKVAEILTQERIHGVPVIDQDKKVIGIVTETNFFTKVDGDLYLAKFVKVIKLKKLPDIDNLNNADRIKISHNTKVSEIMTLNCITVTDEMDLDELFEIFRKKGYHTLPVINDKKVLVGIVTVADIIAMSSKFAQLR